MIQIPKSIASFGALALVAGALTLAVPRAAHAVVAALVQVTNTASTPAIAQDVSKLASQNVELACYTPGIITIGTTSVEAICVQTLPDGSLSGGPYVVPAGQRLIISTISINVTGAVRPVLNEQGVGNPMARAIWPLTAAGAYQFQYPSGIVIAPGSSLSLVFNNIGENAFLYGYLTAN